MATTIQDGTGSNLRAKVNSSHELLTKAETLTEYEQGIADGRAFNIVDTEKALTAITGEQAILYVKNNNVVDLNLKNFFLGLWDIVAGSSDTHLIRIVKNPTGGTLITDASEVTVTNRNFGSNQDFSEELVYGATAGGKTLTGQDTTPTAFIMHTTGRLFLGIDLVLPAGQAMGVTVETNGASASFYAGFTGYKAHS